MSPRRQQDTGKTDDVKAAATNVQTQATQADPAAAAGGAVEGEQPAAGAVVNEGAAPIPQATGDPEPAKDQPKAQGQDPEPAKAPEPAALRQDGPTIEEYIDAGYEPSGYPPAGYAEKPSDGLVFFKEHGTLPADTGAAPTRTLVPCNNGLTEASPAAKALLLEACERFGVNPTLEQQPRELASWNFYPRNRVSGTPDEDAVVIVTSGGVKLKHWADPNHAMDQDTEDTLARVFHAFATDPKTKETVRTALPTDLALPLPAVTGHSQTTAHQFRRGYLAEGGKAEADRRDVAERQAKRKKK